MNFLKSADPSFYKTLARYSPGSSGFDGEWKALAKNYTERFNNLQHAFIKQSHYDPAARKIKSSIGLDVNRYSPALQNVLWSVATQHGTGGANSVFRNAGVRQGMSEAEIIRRVYAERSNVNKYFSSSSAAIKRSVANRFENELQDALRMLG